MKKIAVVTMARNDDFFLNRWIAYYGREFGQENLYIYLDGEDQAAPATAGKANVIKVKRVVEQVVQAEKKRLHFLSNRAAELLKTYDLVIGCDADEILMVEPNSGKTLCEYLSGLKIKTSVSGLGLDVGQHMTLEQPFDPNKHFLQQRRYALVNTRFTKTSVIAKPVQWGRGFHRVRQHNFHIDKNLFLLHFGNIDYDILLQKYNHPDTIARCEQKHFQRARIRVVRDISYKKAVNGDKVFGMARIIQTIFRPVYAWNKPSMLKMRWVVKLPERFKNLDI